MMRRQWLAWAGGVVLAASVLLPAAAEFRSGATAWSKHHDTALLAEPKPLAGVQANVGFAEELQIMELRGPWLHVQGSSGAGWVYQGNVAAEKPQLPPADSLTTLDASATDTVAAARPLAPAAADYAGRRGATDAQADIDWVDAQAGKLTGTDRIAYMTDHQKGEYQR